jgi:hypothetical protein
MARLPPIQRTSSIEREPRTLGIDQIQSARVRWARKILLYISLFIFSILLILFLLVHE